MQSIRFHIIVKINSLCIKIMQWNCVHKATKQLNKMGCRIFWMWGDKVQLVTMQLLLSNQWIFQVHALFSPNNGLFLPRPFPWEMPRL